jgi:hypothetical protein
VILRKNDHCLLRELTESQREQMKVYLGWDLKRAVSVATE